MSGSSSMESKEDGFVDMEEAWSINLDDLELGEEIGAGSFGRVFKAMYFGTEVAVKLLVSERMVEELDDEELAMKYLAREVATLRSMRHPNIVNFMGMCYQNRDIFIVTEFVPGGTLRNLLKKGQPLDWLLRMRIGYDIACAMAYLHSRKVIFRDLKSKNILMDEKMRAKICDFGFARFQDKGGARAMTLCGTDPWMAPEVILGHDYDSSADVFSYGIVLFEILTREKADDCVPRSPANAFELPVDIARKHIPADAPPEFVELAFHTCKYEAKQRPKFPQIVQGLTQLMKIYSAKQAEAVAAAAAASESKSSSARFTASESPNRGETTWRRPAQKAGAHRKQPPARPPKPAPRTGRNVSPKPLAKTSYGSPGDRRPKPAARKY